MWRKRHDAVWLLGSLRGLDVVFVWNDMYNVLPRTPVAAQGQRAQRIEMLLLHEFYGRKSLLPDKLTSRERDALARRDAEDDGEDAPAEAPGAGALSALRAKQNLPAGSDGSSTLQAPEI